MKPALYARFSTDKQKESSIEDQHRLGRKRCAAEGWGEPLEFADTETSGSTPVALRAGGKALLTAAMAGEFDVLVVEGLDRISRDSVEAERTVRRLEHRGVRIIGLADGYDSKSSTRKLHRGMRGLINEVYLDDLRAKTHRGLSGQFERGYSAGGRCFGYTTVPDGEAGKRLVIDPEQAEWVRKIFVWYAGGWGVARIAARLNEMGVPTARGGTWAASAIHGREDRGTGILNNELYRGVVVWNRAQFVKDPDTGKRQRIDRPAHEVMRREDPDLRIISDELWDMAHRPTIRPGNRGPRTRGQVFRTLFSGILRCATCGGAVTALNTQSYGCSTRKERGASVCQGVSVSRPMLDRRLLAEVRNELLAPAALAHLHSRVQHHLAEARRAAAGDTARARRAELDAEIANLVNAIAAVGTSPALTERLKAAEQQRAALVELSAEVPQVIDNAIGKYRALAMNLDQVLQGDITQARQALGDLLGTVIIGKAEGGVYAEMEEPAARLMLSVAAGSISANGCGDAIFLRRRVWITGGPRGTATKVA